jgi:hypothetical protein
MYLHERTFDVVRYVCVYVHMCVCTHVCVCTYVCMYVHTYIHMTVQHKCTRTLAFEIFCFCVPRLVEGGPAHLSSEIKVGDRVMGIDGKSLYTKGNGYQRVSVLKSICIERFFVKDQKSFIC